MAFPDAGVLELLRRGAVELLGRIAWSSNATFLAEVTLDGDSGPHTLQAVYKPLRGERPLHDFPAGIYRREIAAFELAAALGWDLVPETVLIDGPLGEGSLQRFVEVDYEDHYFTMHEEDDPDLARQLRRICCFDLLANNTDRKSGHCLLDLDRHVWAIDNALSFHAEFKLRTVIWDFSGERIDAGLLDDVAALLDNGLPASLHDLLDPFERDALLDPGARHPGGGDLPPRPDGSPLPLAPRLNEERRSAARLERLDQLGQHLVDVAHDAEVGDTEDRRLLVLVDGDDVLGALHADQVLGRTRDAAGHVDRRLHDLAGLTDLVGVGNPTGVDDGAACAGGAPPSSFASVSIISYLSASPRPRPPETTTAASSSLGPPRLLDVAVGDHGATQHVRRHLEGPDGRCAATGFGCRERLRPNQHDGRSIARERRGDVGRAAEDRRGGDDLVALDRQVDVVGQQGLVDLRREPTRDVTPVGGGAEQDEVGSVTGGDLCGQRSRRPARPAARLRGRPLAWTAVAPWAPSVPAIASASAPP